MATRLLFEPPTSALTHVARDARVFVLTFADRSVCLLKPQTEPGMRTLYAFSKELIGKAAWIDVHEELLVVGKTLVFEMVGMRNYQVGSDLVLARYQGMRS